MAPVLERADPGAKAQLYTSLGLRLNKRWQKIRAPTTPANRSRTSGRDTCPYLPSSVHAGQTAMLTYRTVT